MISKYKNALDRLTYYVNSDSYAIDLFIDDTTILNELVTKEHKYRRHDLRKNYHDMPTEAGIYWVYAENDYGEHKECACGCHLHSYTIGVGCYMRFDYIANSCGKEYTVRAWREIERFEETKNE